MNLFKKSERYLELIFVVIILIICYLSTIEVLIPNKDFISNLCIMSVSIFILTFTLTQFLINRISDTISTKVISEYKNNWELSTFYFYEIALIIFYNILIFAECNNKFCQMISLMLFVGSLYLLIKLTLLYFTYSNPIEYIDVIKNIIIRSSNMSDNGTVNKYISVLGDIAIKYIAKKEEFVTENVIDVLFELLDQVSNEDIGEKIWTYYNYKNLMDGVNSLNNFLDSDIYRKRNICIKLDLDDISNDNLSNNNRLKLPSVYQDKDEVTKIIEDNSWISKYYFSEFNIDENGGLSSFMIRILDQLYRINDFYIKESNNNRLQNEISENLYKKYDQETINFNLNQLEKICKEYIFNYEYVFPVIIINTLNNKIKENIDNQEDIKFKEEIVAYWKYKHEKFDNLENTIIETEEDESEEIQDILDYISNPRNVKLMMENQFKELSENLKRILDVLYELEKYSTKNTDNIIINKVKEVITNFEMEINDYSNAKYKNINKFSSLQVITNQLGMSDLKKNSGLNKKE